jgi:hypothetical protein
MNVERGMSFIASCQMSVKNLSSHVKYNWGIWKAIILLFLKRKNENTLLEHIWGQ